jgi:hypothetical protein
MFGANGNLSMTHEQLVAIAREEVKDFRDPEGRCRGLEELPKVTVLDAVVVWFESDQHDGKIEVFLERDSGKFITATLIPHKLKPAS